jgi:hypothetical protein
LQKFQISKRKMMKHLHFSALFLTFVFCTAWKEKNEPQLLTDPVMLETKDRTISHKPLSMPADRADFSGEWKLNESKSELDRKFPICIFGEGDRALSKTMKVAAYEDFLSVTVSRPLPYGRQVASQETVTFDGKESEATIVGRPREKSSATWSDDGQTMTINSVKSFKTISDDADITVTEVWKLINDGNAMSVQVNSSSTSGENTLKLIYDKL